MSLSTLRPIPPLGLETHHRGPDRRERTELVLLGTETVCIGAVRGIDGLIQQIGKVLVEIGFVRTRLRYHVSRDVPGSFRRQLRIEVVGAMGHVKVEEVRRCDQASHSGAIIEAIAAPQRRHHITEIGCGKAAADALPLGTVTVNTSVRVDRLAARRDPQC